MCVCVCVCLSVCLSVSVCVCVCKIVNIFCRYYARIDSVTLKGASIDSRWKLIGSVIVKRPYKADQKVKLAVIKSEPYKWSAGKDGKTSSFKLGETLRLINKYQIKQFQCSMFIYLKSRRFQIDQNNWELIKPVKSTKRK